MCLYFLTSLSFTIALVLSTNRTHMLICANNGKVYGKNDYFKHFLSKLYHNPVESFGMIRVADEDNSFSNASWEVYAFQHIMPCLCLR